jgi:hypothetical protein
VLDNSIASFLWNNIMIVTDEGQFATLVEWGFLGVAYYFAGKL